MTCPVRSCLLIAATLLLGCGPSLEPLTNLPAHPVETHVIDEPGSPPVKTLAMVLPVSEVERQQRVTWWMDVDGEEHTESLRLMCRATNTGDSVEAVLTLVEAVAGDADPGQQRALDSLVGLRVTKGLTPRGQLLREAAEAPSKIVSSGGRFISHGDTLRDILDQLRGSTTVPSAPLGVGGRYTTRYVDKAPGFVSTCTVTTTITAWEGARVSSTIHERCSLAGNIEGMILQEGSMYEASFEEVQDLGDPCAESSEGSFESLMRFDGMEMAFTGAGRVEVLP